ncbi:dihydroxyacetone kinase subunit DhaL [Pendulispora albinea]|uniref:Dihydroxyacetone kinase subunit L n=1 Tax=Pendulispora albinea TaxID=2741071 RepID=A0ABZ2M627_9BACT
MNSAMARSWITTLASALEEQTDYLTQLDSAIGDADHGANMRRGFAAAVAAVEGSSAETPGDVLIKAGTTLISKVGGASGPLYGSAFRAMGKELRDPIATGEQLRAALAEGLAAVQRLGTAAPGDKTMVDAYAPALAAFEQELRNGATPATAAARAADAAEEGMRATTSLQARKGRASYLGARSVGHQDPGATSTAMMFRALARVMAAP